MFAVFSLLLFCWLLPENPAAQALARDLRGRGEGGDPPCAGPPTPHAALHEGCDFQFRLLPPQDSTVLVWLPFCFCPHWLPALS